MAEIRFSPQLPPKNDLFYGDIVPQNSCNSHEK